MIYEMRTYTFHPGKMPAYLKLAEEVGRPIRKNDYGTNHGYWTAEFGTLNQVWHLWSYNDLNERAAFRDKLARNSAWVNEYTANVRPLLQRQDIRLMNPVVDLKPPSGDGHVYELRYYRTQAGRSSEWAKIFRNIMPVREKYSANVGVWHSEAPQPHEIMHLWVYGDLNECGVIRAKVAQDPEWHKFLATAGPLLEEMHSIVLLPTNFSPMK